jgi:hypothetical protein
VTRSDTISRPLASLVIAVCLAMAATPSWAGGEPAPGPPVVDRPRRAVARLKRLGPGLERFATQTSKEMIAELKRGHEVVVDNVWTMVDLYAQLLPSTRRSSTRMTKSFRCFLYSA